MSLSCRPTARGRKSSRAAPPRSNILRGARTGTRSSLDASPPPKDGQVAPANIWNTYIVTRSQRGAPWGVPRQLTRNGSSESEVVARRAADCLQCAGAASGHRPRWHRRPRAGRRPRGGRTARACVSCVVPRQPDDYYKAYNADCQSSIWSVPVTGGTPRLLVRFDYPSRRSARREFATDGQRFYFTVSRDESDIWTMELLRK